MPRVATDTMLNRRINSAGTLFSPVATCAPIKWGRNTSTTPQDRRNEGRPARDQPHTDGSCDHPPAHQS